MAVQLFAELQENRLDSERSVASINKLSQDIAVLNARTDEKNVTISYENDHRKFKEKKMIKDFQSLLLQHIVRDRVNCCTGCCNDASHKKV